MRNHQLAGNQSETIVIGNINEINKRKLNSFYNSLELSENTAVDENQNGDKERLCSSSSYYASPPLNSSSIEKDASNNTEALILEASLGGNMDVIKEFRTLFLKDYLEKNKLGRKSKLSSPTPTGYMSRSFRKSSSRRSIDKETMNEASKKEFEAFQNDVYHKNHTEESQSHYSQSYSENNNLEYSNYPTSECINNLLSGHHHYLGSSVPLSSNRVIHQQNMEESLIVPTNSFQSGYFADSYQQYHNSYLHHLHHHYHISRSNENKPYSRSPSSQPISSFYSASYGGNDDTNSHSHCHSYDSQYFAVEQQQRMLYRHNTPRRRNFAATESLSESFSENHSASLDYQDQTKIFNFDVES